MPQFVVLSSCHHNNTIMGKGKYINEISQMKYINTEDYENIFYVARNRCNIADVEWWDYVCT